MVLVNMAFIVFFSSVSNNKSVLVINKIKSSRIIYSETQKVHTVNMS